MIKLIGRTVYNADRLEGQTVETLFGPLARDLHDYLVFLVEVHPPLLLTQTIRNYNLITVNNDGYDKAIVSGNRRDLLWFVSQLSRSDDKAENALAEYFISSFPDLFKGVPRNNKNALVPWK